MAGSTLPIPGTKIATPGRNVGARWAIRAYFDGRLNTAPGLKSAVRKALAAMKQDDPDQAALLEVYFGQGIRPVYDGADAAIDRALAALAKLIGELGEAL